MSRGNQPNKRWGGAAIGAVAATVLGFCLHQFTFGSGLVNLSYDLLVVALPHTIPNDAVVIGMDEESHEKLGQPYIVVPWDRSLHAQLIERLTVAGAKAVVFDIVFSDPNPANPEADQRLANAIKKNGRVVLAADNVPKGNNAYKIVPLFGLFETNAADFGSDEVKPSQDMVVREHTPERQIYSLSWAAAKVVKAKATRQPNAAAINRWMNYYCPPQALSTLSYYQALDTNAVPTELFRDKAVFIGSTLMTRTSGERKDEYRTPFSFWLAKLPFSAGVEIQAMAFLNVLRGDWLTRLPLGVELTAIILWGLLAGIGLIQLRPLAATGVAFAALALVIGGSYLFCRLQLTWFPWLILTVQVAVALFWSVVFNSIQLYVQKRLYEYSLSLYLSPKLVKKFSGNPDLLKPGAEKQTLSILFTDIANFTSISEGMDSDELAKVMNEYFHTAVAQCIHATDGTVVKYIGDAIFAFWNAPDQQADHEFRVCETALRFRDLPPQYLNRQPLVTRIGIHTGVANVGNFGSIERVDYTALGENINLASRMEGLNKYLGTQVLITRSTKDGIGDRLVTRSLGLFRLKGFEKPVGVYELAGWPAQAEATRAWREAFDKALVDFQGGDLPAAAAGFQLTLKLHPDDGPAKFYLARIEELRHLPPAERRTGETELKEK